MLIQQMIEFSFRGIPEMLITLFGIGIIADKKLCVKKYILLSIVLGYSVFLVRMLPIYFGIHTILATILVISVVYISGVSLIKSIYASLFMISLLSFCEYINLVLLDYFHIDSTLTNISLINRVILTSPSLILYILFTLSITIVINIKRRCKK